MPKGVDHLREFEASEQDLLVQKSLMPKGVDHKRTSLKSKNSARVQKSLMPKGVDHVAEQAKQPAARQGAKIFDAERR